MLLTWQNRWMQLCDLVASWSQDTSTKLGAVIVDVDNIVLSVGWNGFPRGVDGTVQERYDRPQKYLWTEHAERNAIYNAAAKGVSLQGSTLYTQSLPCPDCARAIIQSGIDRVIVRNKVLNDRWAEVQAVSFKMLTEAAINLCIIDEGGIHE